jgi:N-acetylmuramoyl-L-alanine amidase
MYQINKKITKFNQTNQPLNASGGIMHSTGNGDDSVAGNYNYFNTADRGANAHFFLDSTEIAQFTETWNKAFHARSPANEMFIGVEMCETTSLEKFQQIWNRTIWLWANLFTSVIYPRITKVTIDNLRSHHEENDINHAGDSGNHVDPTRFIGMFGKTMNDLRSEVQIAIDNICFEKAANSTKIIKSPEYWVSNCQMGKTINGSWMAQVIKNFVAMYRTCQTFEETVDYLVTVKILGSPDYWKNNCKDGGVVNGYYARKLLIGMGSKLI